MTPDFDLIVFERERRLCGLRLSIAVSRRVFDEQTVNFHGTRYWGLKPFGEWMALCDESKALVGLAIICIFQPDVVQSRLFQAENVSKKGADFHVLLAPTGKPQVEGWPFTTVYTLKSASGEYILYIPDFYSIRQTVALADNFVSESME